MTATTTEQREEAIYGSIAIDPIPPGLSEFPPEAQFVITALEAGPRPLVERQKEKRTPHRVVAELKLFSDREGSDPWTLYTRQVSPKALGFVCDRALPLSHGGVVVLPSLDDRRLVRAFCTILRCRPAAGGWYEGALYFNRMQPVFQGEG